ncbi:MAG: DsbE family thiol:disulfide interchange protein [Burkholderiales bacterium]|nr:DsbE family thiol:disulfide interchange protein [Burkholderiales bacterium]
MKHWRIILPLLVLAVLAVFLAEGLTRDPRKLPSARVGKPAPEFALQDLSKPDGPLRTPAQMRGRVWLLNVFASWCGACVTEHPRLLSLSKSGYIPIVGLAYKDDMSATRDWLKEHGGDPYLFVAVDRDGSVGIEYGVYGVPETYVIDAEGIIRHRHVGPVDMEFMEKHVKPLLIQANNGGRVGGGS